jgi:hypothetical protein
MRWNGTSGAYVSCLGVNDAVRVGMIKWREPTAAADVDSCSRLSKWRTFTARLVRTGPRDNQYSLGGSALRYS